MKEETLLQPKLKQRLSKIDGIAKGIIGFADVAIVEELNMPLDLFPDIWVSI